MADYTSDNSKSDMAMMSLSVNVDFSPVFNWNVKQLFAYLVAEYSTMKNVCPRSLFFSLLQSQSGF